MITEIDGWTFLARIGFLGSISSIATFFSSPGNFARKKDVVLKSQNMLIRYDFTQIRMIA